MNEQELLALLAELGVSVEDAEDASILPDDDGEDCYSYMCRYEG